MRRRMIYFFGNGKADGNGQMKALLGGKGAGLAEMTNLGLPVPPGFTITTAVCTDYFKRGKRVPRDLDKDMGKFVRKLESVAGKKFGDPENPLLVSVRSGAMVSMPGMMDTILNLGLNDATVEGLARKTGNGRFAYDCYRRFIGMFGEIVMEIPKDIFSKVLDERKSARGMAHDIEMTEDDMRYLVESYKRLYAEKTGREFPQDPFEQLKMARDAVFQSWQNPRAIEYRRIYHISESIGTAVNVQTMVFGNMDNSSGTGVGFTRSPSTGENHFYGEYLINAQGEDVVAGIRTPLPIEKMKDDMPDTYLQLRKITQKLERHYRDMQDFEFTIESGKLYFLQTRSGKRTGHAGIKVAVDMVKEKLITPMEALLRVDQGQMEQLLHPIFDPGRKEDFDVIAKGLNASPGAAAGKIVFDADKAVQMNAKGERVILVRKETSPDDIHGFVMARGILTSTGGMTSHAAVVSRQMGKPAVVGCSALNVDEEGGKLSVKGTVLEEGDYISIDGTTGEVFYGDVPTYPSDVLQILNGTMKPEQSQIYRYFQTLMSWADKFRVLQVRANADIPRDASAAIKLGAEGIGLCRTEHMFFAEDRLPLVQKMILAETEEEIRSALDDLLPLQREDFRQMFEIMDGYAVTIRTLDPPLHEFLPKREIVLEELAQARSAGDQPRVAAKEKILDRIDELHELNPMMGRRGCRLGITFPQITRMQVRAIFEAACETVKKGKKVVPEVMIPIVGHVNEFTHQKAIVDKIAAEVMAKSGVTLQYKIGTMIEVPRAALTADEIAGVAEFFSFGTNDLTQMTYAYSRDDAGKFLHYYLEHGILERDPFVTVDQKGVGGLMKIAVELGRKRRQNLKVGICGEHGGEAASVIFCHELGLNYVSCSPFRIPVARLAAGQAAVMKRLQSSKKRRSG